MVWVIWSLIIIGVVGFGSASYAKQKKRERQQEWEQEQARLRDEQKQKELKRAERAAKAAAEDEKKFETIEGFLRECEICMNHAKKTADAYAESARSGKKSIDDRLRHIIWESLYLILQSENPQTIESRIGVMCANLEKMKWPHIPIGERELKIVSTHYYYIQIKNLLEKIDSYKTQQSKEKAAIRMGELFQESAQEKMVYQQALNDFKQKLEG